MNNTKTQKHPSINSTQILTHMCEFSAEDFGLSEKEFDGLDGEKVVVVSVECEDNYFNVIVVDKNIEMVGLSDYHMGF